MGSLGNFISLLQLNQRASSETKRADKKQSGDSPVDRNRRHTAQILLGQSYRDFTRSS